MIHWHKNWSIFEKVRYRQMCWFTYQEGYLSLWLYCLEKLSEHQLLLLELLYDKLYDHHISQDDFIHNPVVWNFFINIVQPTIWNCMGIFSSCLLSLKILDRLPWTLLILSPLQAILETVCSSSQRVIS